MARNPCSRCPMSSLQTLLRARHHRSHHHQCSHTQAHPCTWVASSRASRWHSFRLSLRSFRHSKERRQPAGAQASNRWLSPPALKQGPRCKAHVVGEVLPSICSHLPQVHVDKSRVPPSSTFERGSLAERPTPRSQHATLHKVRGCTSVFFNEGMVAVFINKTHATKLPKLGP